MKKNTLLKTAVTGSVITAICCFTPVLVWLFAMLGLAALTIYLDYVLFPALVIFLAITAYAYFFKKDD